MKKILLVSCEGLGNGGVQTVMMGIVRNLSKEYLFDVLLLTSEKRYYDEEFESYGGRILRIPRYEGKNSIRKRIDYYIRGHKLYKSVIKILNENGPYDVIHCNDEFENGPILKAAAKMCIPIRISHTHVISQKYNIVANALEKYRSMEIDKYATIKLGCSLEACKSFYLRAEDVVVINNSYDDNKFDKRNFKNKVNKSICLVQVGSFNPNKNQIFSVKILNEIVKKHSDVELHFVGFSMGDYKKKIENEIELLGLNNRVFWHSSDCDIPELLSNATGLLFPSLYEGFGIVLIEAQAMGVKCYSSDTVPKVTNCGGVHFLKLQDGPTVWAEKICLDFEKNRVEHVDYDVKEFSQSNVIQCYKNIYEGIDI